MSREVCIYPKVKVKVPYDLQGATVDEVIAKKECEKEEIISEVKILCATSLPDITPDGITPFEYGKIKCKEMHDRYINVTCELHDLYLMTRCNFKDGYFCEEDNCIWFGCVEAPRNRYEYYDDIKDKERFIESEWSKISMMICANPKDYAIGQTDVEGSVFETIDYIEMKVSQILDENNIDDDIYEKYVYTHWIDKYWDDVYRPSYDDLK